VIFFLGIAVLYGLVALAGISGNGKGSTWKPALGLDLEGGTQITLRATKTPTKANLDEAQRIIDQRINSSGVSEATVTTQGNSDIVVSIPKSTSNADQLEATAKRQAVLRFRLVACGPNGGDPCSSAVSQGAGQSAGAPVAPTAPAGNPRPAPAFGKVAGKPKKPSATTTAKSSAPKATTSAQPKATSSASAPATAGAGTTSGSSSDPNSAQAAMAWAASPDAASIAAFQKYTCNNDGVLLGSDGKPANLPDVPSKPLITCGAPGTDSAGGPYLLSPSVVEGRELTDASAGIPTGQLGWVVNLTMGNDTSKAYPPGSPGAQDDFATISGKLHGTNKQFAIVLDGKVISAPTFNAVINDGKSQISGSFSETSATSLATSLKYGALPIAFGQPTVVTVGPSLAGNQLHAGMLAGAIGLALVMLYCLLYYRGLGGVVVASLFVAASITYAMVLLLGQTAGFTLTLPGIAGLIIAVGITADSFVIFFERMRDEMREGKSMRVAVESGWHRARITRLAANTVSVLSALVLYIFASGEVKGFGFALGLSTIVDLAVLFWFTKPMVSYLAQFKAFNSGRKWSGLSKETLGMDSPRTRTAGGEA